MYRRGIGDLAAVPAADDHTEAHEMVRGMIEEIQLVPEGDHLRVEVRGALAWILRLAEVL